MCDNAQAAVDRAIVENVLPMVYYALDQALTHNANGTQPSRADLMEARRLLPAGYDNALMRNSS